MGLFQKEKGKREKHFSVKPGPFLAGVALLSSVVLHLNTHRNCSAGISRKLLI